MSSSSTKFTTEVEKDDSFISVMAKKSTVRTIVRTVKILFNIISLIVVRFWKLCTSATLIILLVYWFQGGVVSLFFLMFALFGIFYYAQDMFLYYPDQPQNSRIFVESPDQFHLPFENIFTRTEDGVNINLVLIKAQAEAAPTVMLLHGNAGNIGHRLMIAFYLFTECRCNVLLVEYRGYGKSEGSPSEPGLYLDAEAGFNYLLNRNDIDTKQIFIFGSSLGGAVSIKLASNSRYSASIAGLILENTFTSLPDVAKSLFSIKVLDFLPRICYKNEYPSDYRIGTVTMPTLFMSGLNDELIPPQMMQQLHNLSGSKMKRLVPFPGGTHNETCLCPGFYQAFAQFIQEVVSKRSKQQEQHQHITVAPDVTTI